MCPKRARQVLKQPSFATSMLPRIPRGAFARGWPHQAPLLPRPLRPYATSLSLSLYLSLSHTHTCLSLAPQVVVRANAAVTPQLVDRLLASREDISRADRAEAVKTCQEVYEALRTTR